MVFISNFAVVNNENSNVEKKTMNNENKNYLRWNAAGSGHDG